MIHEKLYIRSTLNHDGSPEYMSSLGVDTGRLRAELGISKDVFAKQADVVSWNAICTFF
jgi:hypothetical protein